MRKAALGYLGRFAATKQTLRAMLTRKAKAGAQVLGQDLSPYLQAIEETIRWLEASGILSDAAYAESRSRTLAERGHSRRRIALNLAAKGIDAQTARSAIDRLDEELGDLDLAAARTFARRRRLGCYRPERDDDPKALQRDLAAMARAGFSPDVAKAALKGEE